ncbi:L-ascorbate oxidase [Sesbania bispinosa]|nr:L-ascorbate oxidase [Sesbania bispinosa]
MPNQIGGNQVGACPVWKQAQLDGGKKLPFPDGVLINDCGFGGVPFHVEQGIPWMEEEHKLFLVGLQKVGKGDD